MPCRTDQALRPGLTDPAGNLVGIIQGTTPGQGATNDGVLVMAHLDEIAMVVKRVEPDGTLRVVALGGPTR